MLWIKYSYLPFSVLFNLFYFDFYFYILLPLSFIPLHFFIVPNSLFFFLLPFSMIPICIRGVFRNLFRDSLNFFVQVVKTPGNHRFCSSKGWAELPKTHPWARLWSASFLISIPYFFTYFQRLVIARLFHNFLMKWVLYSNP